MEFNSTEDNTTNKRTKNDAVLIEYPFVVNEEYPNYIFGMTHGDVLMTSADFTFANAVMNSFNYGGVRTLVNFTPTDPQRPVQVFYRGWLVMVCNY